MRIGFLSTRFHGTDGVSLEAQKWAHILEREGHSCFWFAGLLDTPEETSFLCEEAFFKDPKVLELNNRLFGTRTRSRETTNEIQAMKDRLKDAIYAFVEKFEIEVLVPQNILAIPVHVPLGLAFTEFIAETRIPTIAHHHDFAWERERFVITAVPDYLEMAFPPAFAVSWANAVINSSAQTELARRCGLPSVFVPNVLDFDNPPEVDDHGADLRSELGIGPDDLLILQPTRIVPRKGIEHAIELVRQMANASQEVVLVVSHDAGDEGMEYYESLVHRAQDANIRMIFFGDRVHETRTEDAHGRKRFSLWDIYPHADLVTYPSIYEGFGNAFLEALWFRRPILVNRYSIYTRDIEPLGFKVIPMDGVVSNRVVEKVWEIIHSPETVAEWGEHNYQLGKKDFSYTVLRHKLQTLMEQLFGEAGHAGS